MSPKPKPVAEHRLSHVVQRHGSRRHLRIHEPFALPDGFELDNTVPATRGDCIDGPRPCPHVKCRHHLWLDLEQDQSGNWQRGRQGHTSFRPSTMESCALDVAEQGASCEEIGAMLGMDDTRVRQLIERVVEKVKEREPGLAEYLLTR